jgi:hypothetical protein
MNIVYNNNSNTARLRPSSFPGETCMCAILEWSPRTERDFTAWIGSLSITILYGPNSLYFKMGSCTVKGDAPLLEAGGLSVTAYIGIGVGALAALIILCVCAIRNFAVMIKIKL